MHHSTERTEYGRGTIPHLQTRASAGIGYVCRVILYGVGVVVFLAASVGLGYCATSAQLARVKDVATIEGIRDNQLVGYGLVVGLRGTGDSSQTVFPAQSLISALERMGVTVPQTGSNSASNMQVKNTAAVFVVATLPPFSRPGIAWTSRLRQRVTHGLWKEGFC